MKDLVQYLATQLVDNPDEVQVTEVAGRQMTVIELKVAKDDIGKIIGKQGRLANAIRTILSAATAKSNRRAILEIIE
ncbi:MAG: RNA-binding protein [Deltaproteobacteria bacterium RIFOXYA12_FULL_61_11]|nr:MAG: RNA-binding protein [Deltaproteobacteria bacterium RIFOXYA12_FULL_61_11]